MRILAACAVSLLALLTIEARGDDGPPDRPPSATGSGQPPTPCPAETTSEQSGYFSIVEGKDGRLYIGTAKYGANAYLVEFDPATKTMKVVVDAQKEIGTTATGFAAQAKIHTRNNVGASGRIYFGTKQGYPREGEKRTDYPGGYPMVYDPSTGRTRVYPIPVPHQGIISITPDEARGIAYISTCSDERPVESAHFLILDLETGKLSRPDGHPPYVRVHRRRSPRAGVSPDPRRRDRALRPPDRHPRTRSGRRSTAARRRRTRTWPTPRATRSTGRSRPTARPSTPSP